MLMLKRALAYSAVLAAGLVLVSGFAPSPAVAQTISAETGDWLVKPDFGKSAGVGREISAAACVPTTPAFRWCLAVNDDKKYAQFFSIDGRTLVPGKYIRLRGEDEKDDPDSEGAAYDDGYFYVTGSHGRSRHTDKDNDSSYNIFRFKADPATGKPPFEISDGPVVGVESSGALRAAIAASAPVKDFYNTPLHSGGLNIEGLAVKKGRMFVGFRGPSIGGKAFIMGADANSVFPGPATQVKVDELPLGENIGIRDLAAVDGGILVLAGPVREELLPYSIWLWDETSGAIKKKFGDIDAKNIPAKAKAETVLLLETTPEYYRVLVMFDGADNGGPISFKLMR